MEVNQIEYAKLLMAKKSKPYVKFNKKVCDVPREQQVLVEKIDETWFCHNVPESKR